MEGSISTDMGNVLLFQYYWFTTEEIKRGTLYLCKCSNRDI